MNKAGLRQAAGRPEEAVIDDNSGIETAAMFGRAMEDGDKVGREIAVSAPSNNIVALEAAETQRWRRTASTVETDWVATR